MAVFPDQWLGLKEPVYPDDGGVTLLSAEVVFTVKTCGGLLDMQVNGKDSIIGWYIADNNLQLGWQVLYNAAEHTAK